MKELLGDTLSALVHLGLGLLMANCLKQLLQMRAILQGVRQAWGNVCHMNGHHIVVHSSVASL